MKRKGCLVFTKIGSILLITKGGGIPHHLKVAMYTKA